MSDATLTISPVENLIQSRVEVDGHDPSMLISMRNIWKTYQMGAEKVHALHGVSFDIPRGEYIAIIGPSGSGKSTLMNLIGCLDTPTKGSYLLNGKEVASMNDDELARIRNEEIGFVFQTFNLLPRATALHNVELPLVYAGVPAAERTARAKSALEKVELASRMQHRPNELSGGQRQRVAIARVVLKNAPILVLDEATSSLDSEVELAIQEQLLGLMEGKTVIAIAHRLSTIARMDRLVVLEAGRIVESGTHDELLRLRGHYERLWRHQSGGFLGLEPEPTETAAELPEDAPADELRAESGPEPSTDPEPAITRA